MGGDDGGAVAGDVGGADCEGDEGAAITGEEVFSTGGEFVGPEVALGELCEAVRGEAGGEMGDRVVDGGVFGDEGEEGGGVGRGVYGGGGEGGRVVWRWRGSRGVLREGGGAKGDLARHCRGAGSVIEEVVSL